MARKEISCAAELNLGAAPDLRDLLRAIEDNFRELYEAVEGGPGPGGAAPIDAWPVGCVFVTLVDTDPSEQLGGGTWERIAAGRFLVGQVDGDSDFGEVEAVGGAKTSAALVAHSHGIVDGGHTHVQDAHGHTQDAHTHVQNSHNHTQDAHTHVQNSHNHTQDAHTHVQNAHTHVQDAHSHTLPVGATDDTAAAFDRADAGSNTGGANATTNVGTATAVNQNATAVNQNATATNQAATAVNQNATATNQAATAVNQNATATNQAATAVNQAASTGITETEAAGSGEAFSILPPFFVAFLWKRTA